MMKYFFKQRGVALITALLIVALTTVMAVSLASRQYMDVRRTSNIMLADQAYLYALALESFAGQLLSTYRLNRKFDDLEQFQQAMMLFQAIPVEGGSVSATVDFSQAKFNVNTLIDKKGKDNQQRKEYFSRLLASVMQELGMDLSTKGDLENALLDWLDPDEETRLGGAEDSHYEGKDIPYKAANRMMSSISELRLVEGYSKELLEGIPPDPEQKTEAIPGLLHYVTALPDHDSTINVNLVDSPLMIMALGTYIDRQMADELIETRPYEQASSFRQQKVLTDLENDPANPANARKMKEQLNELGKIVDVQSSYFELRGLASVGDSKINLNSLIYVDKSGQKLEVVSRAIGTPGI
ncbi:MAG: type II secretion system minor pseudopilin GspK [Gammaproteobacteria bacterium]|nr:type II secretion system minor pseudopilin GspK [Gammaproteobacteria bacterium]